MDAKIQTKKTICAKNNAEALAPQPVSAPEIHIPARILAYVADCSEANVKKVLRGEQHTETATKEKIEVATLLLQERTNALIEEVKRIVNF